DELLKAARASLPQVLSRRFRHVITEGTRVRQAEAAMAAGNLGAFGQLLDASHQSLRDDYEVSHPELDRLVDVAREAGAAGARLTGAGTGRLRGGPSRTGPARRPGPGGGRGGGAAPARAVRGPG